MKIFAYLLCLVSAFAADPQPNVNFDLTTRRIYPTNVAVLAPGALYPAAIQDRFAQEYSVKEFGADSTGVTNSSTAFRRAIGAAYSNSAGVYIPPGTYLISDVGISNNTRIRGAGMTNTVLKAATSTDKYILYANRDSEGSTNTSNNVRNFSISDLTLRHRLDVDGYSEHYHSLNLNAVSDGEIKRVTFTYPKGDAIYLGSGNTAGITRHNERIKIEDCYFDGIVKSNRNAISVIDGTDIWIRNNYITRMSSPLNPGAIDLEPDSNTNALMRNIYITGNKMEDNSGNAGNINMTIPVNLTVPVQNVVVENNTILGGPIAFAINVGGREITNSTPLNSFIFRGNFCSNTTSRPFVLYGVNGATVSGNTFTGYGNSALIGYNDTLYRKSANISIINNRFERCGTSDGATISPYTVDRLIIANNEFIDSYIYVMDFSGGTNLWTNIVGGVTNVYYVTNQSWNVTIGENAYLCSTNGRLTALVQKEATHGFNNVNNRWLGNDSFRNAETVPDYFQGSFKTRRFRDNGNLIDVRQTFRIGNPDDYGALGVPTNGMGIEFHVYTNLYQAFIQPYNREAALGAIGGIDLQIKSGTNLTFAPAGTELMRMNVNQIGINTTTPGALLDVNGNVVIRTNLQVTNITVYGNMIGGTTNIIGALAGKQPSFTTAAGVTNVANVLSANLTAGSNVTLTTNANGQISIAASGGGTTVTVTEVDGAPSVSANTIKFSNGTVTDNGGGVVTVTISGLGGGTNSYVNGSVVTSPNFTNSSTAIWTLSSTNVSVFPTNLANAQIASGAAIDATKISGTAVTLNANETITGNKTFSGAILQPVDAIGASAIDWSLGNTFSKTIGANTTFTFSNATSGQWITVKVTASGSYTTSWPAVTWQGGNAPGQTASKTDFYTFFYDGTTYYGSASQNY